MAAPLYIAIEGVIGVGKTTLARLLQPEYEARLMLEVFEENPFLADFYGDRERYAFQTQIFFLLSRYRQQAAVRELAGRLPLLSDYLFAKDHLFARLNLAGDELATYRTLYTTLSEHVAAPDLVVYLRASIDTLLARIAARDRPYERGMARDYIAALSRSYDDFFLEYSATPLLVVDTDDLNVVTNADDLADVRTRVRSALGMGTYQQSLPMEGLPRPLQKAHTGSETGGRVPVEARRLSELQAFHRRRNDTYGGGLFVQALRLQENVGALARELALAWEAAREVNPASQETQWLPTLEGRYLPSAGLRGGLAACLAALFQLANEAGVDLEDAILEQLGPARAGAE